MKLRIPEGCSGFSVGGVSYTVDGTTLELSHDIPAHHLAELAFHGIFDVTDQEPEKPVEPPVDDKALKAALAEKAQTEFGVTLDKRKGLATLQAEYDALVANKAKA